jgi:hypothetical protein
MAVEWGEASRELNNDPEVNAIVITGPGVPSARARRVSIRQRDGEPGAPRPRRNGSRRSLR